MNEIASKTVIRTESDWKRVSMAVIKKNGGGVSTCWLSSQIVGASSKAQSLSVVRIL